MQSKYPGKLYFLVGLARAGKSTYVKTWLQNRTPVGVQKIVVCSDEIRLVVNNGNAWCSNTELLVATVAHTMIKSHLLQGREVLFDETNTSLRSLEYIFNIDINAQPIILTTPLDECVRRAHATNQSYLEKPIHRMYRNLLQLQGGGIFHKYNLEDTQHELDEKLIREGIEKVRLKVLYDLEAK